MIRYRTRRLNPVIPTASMADIAFLLIIFFLYSTTFSVDRTSVNLPASVIQQMVETDAAIIAITLDERLFVSDGVVDSQPVEDFDQLDRLVQEIVMQFPGRQFIIKCDQDTPYRTFDRIYEILIRHEVANVSLLTVQKSPPRREP